MGPEIGWLYRQIRRLGVREADLEDVCQDVLLTVFRRWEKYDRDRQIRPWLFGFAFRVTADYRKRASTRHPHLPLEEEPASPDPGPAADLEERRARALLLRALDEVPHKRRAVLVLADLEDVPVPEIAAALGIRLNTAYSRLRVARHELAETVRRLTQRAPGPDPGQTGGPSDR